MPCSETEQNGAAKPGEKSMTDRDPATMNGAIPIGATRQAGDTHKTMSLHLDSV